VGKNNWLIKVGFHNKKILYQKIKKIGLKLKKVLKIISE